MQTLSDVALEIFGWHRKDLACGAYSLSNIRTLSGNGVLTDLYTERIDIAQFNDSLACVKSGIGIAGGLWVGMERNAGEHIEVLAIRLE